MPFLTEELWQRLPGTDGDPKTICVAKYPEFNPAWKDDGAAQSLRLLRSLVTAVRNDRIEKQIPPKAKAVLYLDQRLAELETMGQVRSDGHLRVLAGVSRVVIEKPPAGPWTGFVPLSEGKYKYAVRAESVEAVDAASDQGAVDRRRAELVEVEQQIERAEAALAAPGFVAKAPAQVVEGRRRRLAELQERRRQLTDELAAASQL
jgi:valyl-tRNA synthetase